MEAIRGQSNADFRAKMNIALKEASETEYWLELLHKEALIYCCAQIGEEIFRQICSQNAGIPVGLARLCGRIWRKINRQDACIE